MDRGRGRQVEDTHPRRRPLLPHCMGQPRLRHHCRRRRSQRRNVSTLGSSAAAVGTKTRLPHTMGEEWPAPGMGIFHLTPSSSVHFSGRFFPGEMPRPSPRQPGQSCAKTRPALIRITHSIIKAVDKFVFFIVTSHSIFAEKPLASCTTATIHYCMLIHYTPIGVRCQSGISRITLDILAHLVFSCYMSCSG